MADKKLNAVSTASDGAYVYAEDSSGNQIKISKSDLAQVVAGLVGLNYYYKRRGSVLSDDEINTLFDGGDVYAGTIGDDTMYLIRSYRYGSASCIQYAVGVDTFSHYIRRTSDGGDNWTSWALVP